MLQLAWDVNELSELNEVGRSLLVEIEVLSNKISDPVYDVVGDNFAGKLSNVREKLSSFVKRVIRYRRTPATHILVITISTEDRKKKPYALPVQCLPYKGLKDMEVRAIVNKVIQEMVNRGVKVAGTFH